MEKRILTIQDFSCMGRCSLTVAIPTISAMGVECVSIPTAVLSNHTAFKSWTFLDLTDEMLPIVEKWQDYRHEFDYIYTGYLSNDQISTVIQVIEKLKTEKTVIFVDPAMADNGKLYPGFDENHITAMKELITKADIIKPNLTEACFLSDTPFPGTEKEVPLSFYDTVFEKLAKTGPKFIVITGQEIFEGKVADLFYNVETGKSEFYITDKHPGVYHGTGDLFASAFVGALANGMNYSQAIKLSHDYVHVAIEETVKNKLDGIVYGPDFEKAIPVLVEGLKDFKSFK
ncbi:MAG: pyridoxamine kinase [Bacilli bacterium]